jgi:hypothetical protein
MRQDSMYRGLESLGQAGNRLAKPPPEEPAAGNPHVRVCEGPGWQRPGLPGKRRWRGFLLASLVLVCGGCLKSKVTVVVNPDGSGQVVVSRYFGRQAVQEWETQRAQMTAMDGEGMEEGRKRLAGDPFYNEKALKRDARRFGPSTAFVKARRVDADGGRGSVAVYAFKDINDVCLALDQRAALSMMNASMGSMMDPDEAENEDDADEFRRVRRGKAGIEFSFQTGAVNRLKILLPAMAETGAKEDPDDEPAAEAEDEESEDADEMANVDASHYAMAMARRMPDPFNYRHVMGYGEDAMSRGLAVSVEVEINGAVATSDAAFTNATRKNRFVLIDVDASRGAKDAAAKSKRSRLMDSMGYGDPERMLKKLHAIPGSRVEPKREVTIAFKGTGARP